MRIKWYSPKDKLPRKDTYVIVCISNVHHIGLFFDICKCVRGISQAKRLKLSNRNRRKYEIHFGDEDGNNLVPYRWSVSAGCCAYFGQDVVLWAHIPVISDFTKKKYNL